MTPEQFVEFFGRQKASAIIRSNDQEKAAQAMDAAIRGGFRVVEFTLTVPGALELIQEFSQRDGIAVGAGTVLDEQDATRAVEAGARFLVSPVVDDQVIARATELGVACMPGTHTATEMLTAHRAGAGLCKLFPAPAGGPVYVQSILGPMPFLKIVPTNGVDHLNAGAWMAAGSYAVGFVATLFEPRFMATNDWDAIEARARECIGAVSGD